jgi:hypothetical protein
MKILLLITFISAAAHADMYYECTKQSETEPVNDTSSSPQRIDLDVTNEYSLRLNSKKVKAVIVNEDNSYKPVLRTERIHLGELQVATYEFDGRKCDSMQIGTVTRVTQIGAEDATETAEYSCTCGED